MRGGPHGARGAGFAGAVDASEKELRVRRSCGCPHFDLMGADGGRITAVQGMRVLASVHSAPGSRGRSRRKPSGSRQDEGRR